jgi:molybdopterin synthase catalytic subunit
MTVTVHLFAGAREAVGRDMLELELPPGATVKALRDELGERYPFAVTLLERSAIARNQEYALDSDPISPADEIAVIPPVSGG